MSDAAGQRLMRGTRSAGTGTTLSTREKAATQDTARPAKAEGKTGQTRGGKVITKTRGNRPEAGESITGKRGKGVIKEGQSKVAGSAKKKACGR